MELPKRKKSAKGMFDGIKSKLGFERGQSVGDEEYYDEYDSDYNDYEDDYRDYDDYAPEEKEDFRGTRPSRRSARGGAQDEAGGPHLISLDDVRAHTQVPERLTRDPLAPRHASDSSATSAYVPASASGYRSGYTRSPRMVERASDYMRSTDTSDISPDKAQEQASGYDALFSSSSARGAASSAQTGSRGYDPYDTFEGTGLSSHNPTRSLCVMKPISYGEVERIAKTVKAGDAVVLGLRSAPDSLAKRILDFSFGVSSALDARVDCVADKVFVIARGQALSNEERTSLRNQGVL